MAAIEISTLTDLLTDLAEKIGETEVNTDDRRKRMINNAYRKIASKAQWWWLETSDATTTTTTALSYTLPTNFRSFHQLNPVKIVLSGATTWYQMIPFSQLQRYDGTSGVVQLPQFRRKKVAYIYGSTIYFVQSAMTAGGTVTYYYYKEPVGLDAGSDEPLMPDLYREMISLYAAGMYLSSQGGEEAEQGKDYLALFDDYLRDMFNEHDDRLATGVKVRALDPEEAEVFNNN